MDLLIVVNSMDIIFIILIILAGLYGALMLWYRYAAAFAAVCASGA
jgi:hypothetical protein